ncbi:dTDP-4-dehydrorhamnose 3,5-epimerase [Chelativorans sp. AA-79]|uniref:dTDP-4-dehydrorhamnose 3,5-epimerase n=1 Tax=Chelativorans sp. AA-79 TaxID=3028735 RepID=UPI0023F9AB93|nr:dTDP-4-dehydrorhamnose 3,5-epimerase [Chelativorans sp. AA-79]WEX10241.1 dTDP-4-dehydrorhamnose 3,5-epimerase [Chelativorans sp. AA-79]
MPEIRALGLEGVLEIVPRRFADERGFFSETYNAGDLAAAGIRLDFVQDNHSLSISPGTVRGLHFQKPPFAQDKLVRVVRGAVFDVAVDIRAGSPTFGQWVGVELSAARWNQLLVPRGFAHGFMTIEPETEVTYKVTAPYSRDHDCAIRFDDPAIGIDWPAGFTPLLSPKDRAAPLLAGLDTGFRYGAAA